MPVYFADSSAILKVYLSEPGSNWLKALDLGSLTLSALAIPEVASAIARRRRERVLSEAHARLLWRNFREDLRGWQLIGLAHPLLTRAAALLIRSTTGAPMRALDALQLACALEAQRLYRRAGIGGLTLLTADTRLEVAARRANLLVENPERHGS